MKRSDLSKGQLTAVKVLEAAERLLITRGGAALSMRGVAEEAGMRLGNLQYYFPAKRDLLQALLLRWKTQYEERAGEWMSDDMTPLAQLQGAGEGLFDDLFTPTGSRLFWELWVMAVHDVDAAELMASIYSTYREAVAEVFLRIEPGLSKENAMIRASLMVAVVEGIGIQVGYGKTPPVDVQALKAEFLALLKFLALKGN